MLPRYDIIDVLDGTRWMGGASLCVYSVRIALRNPGGHCGHYETIRPPNDKTRVILRIIKLIKT